METYDNLFGIEEEVDDKYTSKVSIPQYLPKDEKPRIDELYSTYKYDQLVSRINRAEVTEEEKKFLLAAAARHLVFNYSKIANYYAHSSKEVQELMEDSALVILDIDDAIAQGYVKLSKNIEKIMRTTGRMVEE